MAETRQESDIAKQYNTFFESDAAAEEFDRNMASFRHSVRSMLQGQDSNAGIHQDGTGESSDEEPDSEPESIANMKPKVTGTDAGSDQDGHGPTEFEGPMTTMMIRNLPRNIAQCDLAHELDRSGYRDVYDFLYMPSTIPAGRGKGYAFINFLDPDVAMSFANTWHKTQRFGLEGRHTLNISFADVQGRDANIAAWCTSKTSRIRNPNYQPLVRMMRESGYAGMPVSGPQPMWNQNPNTRPTAIAQQWPTHGYPFTRSAASGWQSQQLPNPWQTQRSIPYCSGWAGAFSGAGGLPIPAYSSRLSGSWGFEEARRVGSPAMVYTPNAAAMAADQAAPSRTSGCWLRDAVVYPDELARAR